MKVPSAQTAHLCTLIDSTIHEQLLSDSYYGRFKQDIVPEQKKLQTRGKFAYYFEFYDKCVMDENV